MRIKIVPAVTPEGEAGHKMSIESGGYRKIELPREYLDGNCFWIKKGKHPAIIMRTNFNPLTRTNTPMREIIKVSLSRTLTSGEVERLIAFMKESGENLVNIKDVYESGYLELEPTVIDI